MPSIILGDKTKMGGILPRLSNKKLPPNAAQTAQNVDLLAARLEALKDLGAAVAAGISGKLTIYKWYRNSSSEWLSTTGVEKFAIGPIRDDQFSRVYYTDSGTLKMSAWNSSKVTRTVGLTAPAAKPSITTTPEDYFRFDPASDVLTLDVRQTLSSSALSDSDTIDETGITMDRYVQRPDGKLDVYFRVSRQSFNLNNVSVQNNPDFARQVFYRLNIGGTYSANLPTTLGGNIYGKTLELIESASKYGRMQVHAIAESGITVDLNVIWTVSPTDSGTPTSDEANPQSSDYVAKLTLNMNYIGSSGSSAGEQYAHYVTTNVDDLGEESPASPISDEVRFYPGQKIVVALGANPGGVITNRRLYRSAAGTSQDGFFFVATIAAGTTSYNDVLADSELGDPMPLFANPPAALDGIALLPNGSLVGWKNKNLYYSEPNHPYSWPTKYQLTTESDIMGVGVTNNEHVVLTKGNPEIVYGTHPDNQSIEKIPHHQACSNGQSIAVHKSAVFYVSPDGINEIKHGVGRLLTEGIYTPTEWKALTPSSAIAAVQDKLYMVWMTGIKLIFDMDEGIAAMTSQTVAADALYADLPDDTLYVLTSDDEIKAWGAGSALTYTWRSKDYQHTRNWAPTCGRVVADSYPFNIKLYANNVLVDTTSVTSEASFNFPGTLVRTKVWSVQVEHNAGIDEIRVATSKGLLR